MREGMEEGREKEEDKKKKMEIDLRNTTKKVENKKCWGQSSSKSIFKLKIQF